MRQAFPVWESACLLSFVFCLSLWLCVCVWQHLNMVHRRGPGGWGGGPGQRRPPSPTRVNVPAMVCPWTPAGVAWGPHPSFIPHLISRCIIPGVWCNRGRTHTPIGIISFVFTCAIPGVWHRLAQNVHVTIMHDTRSCSVKVLFISPGLAKVCVCVCGCCFSTACRIDGYLRLASLLQALNINLSNYGKSVQQSLNAPSGTVAVDHMLGI